jgi:cytoskeletal protein CcmA (bactofilin family)
MFGSNGKEMKGPMAVDNNVLNTIARGTVLEGKIVTKGDMRVEGKVIGIITCDAKLVIGEHGVVEGQIDARNAYIAGEVRGTVVVRELLQLQERGKILGDIYTQKLSVAVGATFTGNCRMGKEAEVPAVDSAENSFAKGPKKVVFGTAAESDTPKSSFLNGPKEASL